MPPYKLISFDADDTLWDFNAMMARGTAAVVAAFRARFGDHYPQVNAEALRQAQHRYMESQDPLTVDYAEARRTVFRRLGQDLKLPDFQKLGDDLLEVYLAARSQRYELFPDTHSTLQALGQKYPLAYMTNGTSFPHQAGLEAYFQVVLRSDDGYARKPKADMFQAAAQQAGCQVSEILHIGDSVVADVGGATWAGAEAIWFNPTGAANQSKVKVGREIRQLAELVPMLLD